MYLQGTIMTGWLPLFLFLPLYSFFRCNISLIAKDMYIYLHHTRD